MSEPNVTLKYSFIIVAYKSQAHIVRCIEAILAQDIDCIEIIIWNNDLDIIDLTKTNRGGIEISVLGNGENLGFAEGNNRAALVAKGEWLILINPDAFAEKDFLLEVQKAIEARPHNKLLTALLLDEKDPNYLDGSGDAMSFFGFPFRMGYGQITKSAPKEMAQVFSPCGAGLIIKADFFKQLNGFDARFFCYCEDVDLGYRAQLLGEACILIPTAKLRHIGSASLGVRSDFALYYGYRNRLWVYVKNTPVLWLYATVLLHIFATIIMATKDILSGKLKVVVRGLLDGILGLGIVIKQRKITQKTKTIRLFDLLKKLSYNPKKIVMRSIDVRKL